MVDSPPPPSSASPSNTSPDTIPQPQSPTGTSSTHSRPQTLSPNRVDLLSNTPARPTSNSCRLSSTVRVNSSPPSTYMATPSSNLTVYEAFIGCPPSFTMLDERIPNYTIYQAICARVVQADLLTNKIGAVMRRPHFYGIDAYLSMPMVHLGQRGGVTVPNSFGGGLMTLVPPTSVHSLRTRVPIVINSHLYDSTEEYISSTIFSTRHIDFIDTIVDRAIVAIVCKYLQHSEMAVNLVRLNTPIVYASAVDYRWGTGRAISSVDAADERCWCGANGLGQILTAVRSFLIEYYNY